MMRSFSICNILHFWEKSIGKWLGGDFRFGIVDFRFCEKKISSRKDAKDAKGDKDNCKMVNVNCKINNEKIFSRKDAKAQREMKINSKWLM